MSSLPMISHRLFVAAARPEKPGRPRPEGPSADRPLTPDAPLRTVEVVLDDEPGVRRIPRPARAEVCVI